MIKSEYITFIDHTTIKKKIKKNKIEADSEK
jgi:hypothetical protein